MPAYEGGPFDPPAPLAKVMLRPTGLTAPSMETLMLLDTGADITAIPETAVRNMGLIPDPDRQYVLAGFDNKQVIASVFRLELVFVDKVFAGQFVTIDQESGYLGRNILNRLKLLFDGPGQIWSQA